MNVEQYNNYFDKFREPIGLVNSLYQIDLLDLNSAMNDLKGGKYLPDHLVLEAFTVGTSEVNADNIQELFFGALLLIRPIDIRDNSQIAKTNILNDTYRKTAQIKRAMISDKLNTCTFMRGLDIDSIMIEKIGPVLNNQFGWRLSYQININIDDQF